MIGWYQITSFLFTNGLRLFLGLYRDYYHDADYLVSVRHRTADAPFSYMLFIKFVNSHWLSVCKRQYDIS